MDSIIFDVDGTLWDSTEIVAQAWTWYLQTREHMDITLTSQRLMSLFGQLLPDIARQLFPDLSEAEQLRIIDGCCQAEHEALLKKCAPLYEGLEHTLQELGKKYRLSESHRFRSLFQGTSVSRRYRTCQGSKYQKDRRDL